MTTQSHSEPGILGCADPHGNSLADCNKNTCHLIIWFMQLFKLLCSFFLIVSWHWMLIRSLISVWSYQTVDCGVVELLNDEAVQSAELSMPKGASWVDLLEEEEEVACATPHTEGPCELLREGTKKRKLTLINAQETIDASIGELLPRKSKRLVREINWCLCEFSVALFVLLETPWMFHHSSMNEQKSSSRR